MKSKASSALYGRIREILESARAGVARSVNTTQVIANWLIGREIVEEEQKGKAKAAYGERLLAELSGRLQAEYGNGYSVDNLELFRRFYGEYPTLISDALRRKSPLSDSGALAFGCADKNDAVVRYTLGPDQQRKIFASRYKLYLPSEAELRVELRREVRALAAPRKHGDAK